MLLIETVKTSQEKQEEKKKGSDLLSTIFGTWESKRMKTT